MHVVQRGAREPAESGLTSSGLKNFRSPTRPRKGRQALVPLHPLPPVPIVPRQDVPTPQAVTVEPQADPNTQVLLEPHLGVLGPVLSNTVS